MSLASRKNPTVELHHRCRRFCVADIFPMAQFCLPPEKIKQGVSNGGVILRQQGHSNEGVVLRSLILYDKKHFLTQNQQH